MSIAERIIKLRGKRTQGEVGGALWPDIDINAAQQRISRLEKLRDEDFKVKDLRLLADFYGIGLSEILNEKGVVPPCGILQREHVESVCRKVGVIYSSGNTSAINSLECHLEGLVSMLTNRETVNEIINSLNVLLNDNQDFHRRLNTLEGKVDTIIKTEDSDKKAVVGEGRGSTAAR